MPLSATVADLDMVALVVAGPFSTREAVADFLDAEPEERAIMIENARLQGLAPTSSSWDTFVAVMAGIVTVAGVVTGVAGAVTAAYALKAL
jgi:hypothetical protein